MNSKLWFRSCIGLTVLSWGFGVGPDIARLTGSDIGFWVGIPVFALSVFLAITIFRFGVK